METPPPSPSFDRRKFLLGAVSAAALPALSLPKLPAFKTRTRVESVSLDDDGVVAAMRRFTPFSVPPSWDRLWFAEASHVAHEQYAAEAKLDLSLLLGILLACARVPCGFHARDSVGESDLGTMARQFFTVSRVRRLLVATRDLDVGPRVREVLQKHLHEIGPGNSLTGFWAAYVGWFKCRMLECFFDSVPFAWRVWLENLFQ